MKIESVLKRAGGTKVELDGVEYHFAPQEDGCHVAEVVKRAHIDRFLAIPEGYRLYLPEEDGQEAAPVAPVVAEVAPVVATVAPVVLEQDQDGDESDEDEDGEGDETEALDRDALAAEFEAKFGKKPHYKWSVEKIQAALSEE